MRLRLALFLVLLSWTCITKAAGQGRHPHDYEFYRELSAESLSSLSLKYDIDLTRYQTITRQLGPTVIDMTKLPYLSPMLDSGKRPWSAWWFQKAQKEFTGGGTNAILAKYDRVFGLTGKPESAWAEEKRKEHESYATWEGLCDAWAMASLFYPEPKRPISVAGVSFTVNDLKGLVIKSFENTPDTDFTLHGEKFLGNADAWMFPDVFPEQLHRFIDVMLGEHRQAFLMDRDPGVEVWTVPVYRSNYRLERNPENPNSVKVKLWLFAAGASPFDKRESVGTEEITYTYLYELIGDLSADKTRLTVTHGKWLQSGFIDSRANHPDYVLLPKTDKLDRASYNRFVDPAKVDRIVKGAL